ncbi:GTP cyclohydrolase N terminal-domain-containing protein [Lipomyces oligophaga]|uniref:GTP cyclohydrolase N terminal-domain-containing protein n=1 Tax=Lipomyces oligophaga TaxID=45792 RepID=UPI0034CE372B
MCSSCVETPHSLCSSSERPADASAPVVADVLSQILLSVQALQSDYKSLSQKIDSSSDSAADAIHLLEQRINELQLSTSSRKSSPSVSALGLPDLKAVPALSPALSAASEETPSEPSAPASPELIAQTPAVEFTNSAKLSTPIALTSYPGQPGVNPIALDWGNSDPAKRGPIVVSHARATIGSRNAIGAHSGSYGIYHALAVAKNAIDLDHKPDFTNTQPPVQIGPYPQWGNSKKIVAMDPFGHLAPWLYKDYVKDGIEIRPSIAVTKAHMHLPEFQEAVRSGELKVDGEVVVNEHGDLAVTKVAVEPVWYLPGVAERFGIDEDTLRRSLFEDTGGSYPELITRPDIKIFLPPIGGMTAYIFGDPAKTSDPSVRLALRVHDECNGSDVFGSDICTCRPYLIFGIVEAVKEAQAGGSGVVVYFRKEGRALGEVTKYLVYNARKRSGDSAAEYFKRTENVAGVKDMRFQELMPDILHFLGITKIDRMLSMSNMKYDAIVGQGIAIHERVPIPEEMIPDDSRVEIDAKIHSGYYTEGRIPTEEDLKNVKGRQWEDIVH